MTAATGVLGAGAAGAGAAGAAGVEAAGAEEVDDDAAGAAAWVTGAAALATV